LPVAAGLKERQELQEPARGLVHSDFMVLRIEDRS
jgi:hypothetical protein